MKLKKKLEKKNPGCEICWSNYKQPSESTTIILFKSWTQKQNCNWTAKEFFQVLFLHRIVELLVHLGMNKSVVLDVCRHLVVLVTSKKSQSRRASFWVPQIVVGKSARQNQQLVCASLSKVLHSPRICCSAGRRRMAARNQNQASDIESSDAATQNSGNPSKSVSCKCNAFSCGGTP